MVHELRKNVAEEAEFIRTKLDSITLMTIQGTSHMFRHTFSVELLKAGVHIRKVSKALGHSSVTVTAR
jgi:site-specific recombinase XerD